MFAQQLGEHFFSNHFFKLLNYENYEKIMLILLVHCLFCYL